MRLPHWDQHGIKGIISLGLLILIIFIPHRQVSAGKKRDRGNRGERENIHRSPQFKPTPNNITVGPGDRAVLKCRVENLGTKTITWKKHEQIHPLTIGLFTFAPDTRISVDYNQRTNEWSLIIQDVKPSDEGMYHCAISTKDEYAYDINLNVKNTPTITEQRTAVQVSGTEYVERDSPVQLMCNATGKPDPPHNVEWYKDGDKINSDARSGIIITKKIETKVLVSMLVIKSSTMADAGDYICRSSNRDSGMIKVHILNVDPRINPRDEPNFPPTVAAPVEKRDYMMQRNGDEDSQGKTSNLTSRANSNSCKLMLCSLVMIVVTRGMLLRWHNMV